MIILKKFLVYITLVFILTSFSAMAQTNNTIRTIQVTTTEDELNSLVANETCSLREAIILSNERGDRDDFGGCRITRTPSTINSIFSINIILPAGEFKLTRNGFSLIDQDVGNLNVYRPIVIRGAGPEQTIIDGKGIQDIELTGGIVSIEPIPHIPTTLPPLNCVGCSVHFKDLSLKNGHTKSLGQFARPQGSAIYSEIHAVDLENVAIEDSVHNIEAVFSKLGVSAKNISCINNKGGCISTNREILVKDSIFKNNGVALNVSSGEINNSLFTDNIQAIRATSSDLLVITDSTIVDNNPGEQTAIEVVDDNDNTTIRIINSIVAGNFSGTSQRNCTLFFPFASEGFNLIGTDCIGFNKQGDQKLRTRPKLDVLFRPELDSFALDKGKTGCSSIDVYGNPRPRDGDGNGNSQCDIGAVEKQAGQPQADLALSMIDGPNGYFRGVQVDHVLELKNNGPLVANEILVQISLPANASSISTTNPSCSLNQGRVPFLSCIYGSLAANTTNSIPFSFVIDESQVAEEVQLRAQVRGAVNDFDITNDALDITLTPFDVAVVPTTGSDFVLKIIETVDPVTEGELLGYILEVTNAGPEVGKATVSATYPEGTTPPTTCQAQSKKAECNIGVLEVNASKQFLFSIKGDTRNTPFIEATVTATSTNDPDLSNNSTKQKTDVTPLPPAPNKADLVMRVMNLSVAQVDGEALFALSVKNLSNKVARNTQVVITASDGLSYKKPLLSECVQLGAVLTCDLATIQALQEVGLVVEMETGSEVGTETMRFEVSSDTEDPVSENNVLTHSLSLVSQPVSDLRIIESQTQLDKNIATTNSVNVSALAFQVSGADSTLTALNLKTIGTGNDAIDLSSVKLWEDKNGDGLVNAGDVQLSQGNFALDDGGVRLELQTPLNVSEPVNLLVTVDINSRLARNFGILMAFSLLSFGLVKRLRRNRYVSGALTIVLVITLLALVSCGGQTVKQSITQPPVTKPNQPPQPNQPTVSTKQVNFQLTLESVEAIVPSTNTVNVIGLPIKGTTLTIFE